MEQAYGLYEKAARIDLGPEMKSSDKGIHSASLGGIWQIIVCGFGGVRMIDGTLRIDPKLPDQIHSITYPITWNSNPLRITVTHNNISIINKGTGSVKMNILGTDCLVEKAMTINY